MCYCVEPFSGLHRLYFETIFSQLIVECDDRVVLLYAVKDMVEKFLNCGNLRLIVRMEPDPTLTFVAIALLYAIGWGAHGSYDCV